MAKRLFDIVVSATGLLLLSPLLLAITLWIRLSSPGPALFKQTRVGRFGKTFQIYKFRSMVVNASSLGSSVTTGTDRRITPVGRILRRTKLDELPQLWNVLKGDMSLVGPRPDVPEIIDAYTPAMRRILDVRPGITSVATLHLRDEELLLSMARHPDDAYLAVMVPFKVNLAMAHVDNQSIWFDLAIIAQTLWAISGARLFSRPEHPSITEIRTTLLSFNRQGEAEFTLAAD